MVVVVVVVLRLCKCLDRRNSAMDGGVAYAVIPLTGLPRQVAGRRVAYASTRSPL